jgi:hypothetical protein
MSKAGVRDKNHRAAQNLKILTISADKKTSQDELPWMPHHQNLANINRKPRKEGRQQLLDQNQGGKMAANAEAEHTNGQPNSRGKSL